MTKGDEAEAHPGELRQTDDAARRSEGDPGSVDRHPLLLVGGLRQRRSHLLRPDLRGPSKVLLLSEEGDR